MSLSPPRAELGAELDLGNQHIHWQQPDGCRARGGGWLIGHGMGSGAAALAPASINENGIE